MRSGPTSGTVLQKTQRQSQGLRFTSQLTKSTLVNNHPRHTDR